MGIEFRGLRKAYLVRCESIVSIRFDVSVLCIVIIPDYGRGAVGEYNTDYRKPNGVTNKMIFLTPWPSIPVGGQLFY